MSAQHTPFQLPVKAVEWNIHAATTIKDAAGKVLAECTGNGQHSDDAVRVAAEIEQRVNAHDELVEAISDALDRIPCDCAHSKRQRGEHMSHCRLFDLQAAYNRAAMAKTTGSTNV